MIARIIKTIHIEAARRKSGGASYTGARYRVDLIAEGEISETVGWVVDYADLKALFEPVRKQIDHHCLSDLPGLAGDISPETLESWVNARLQPWPPWFAGVRVYLAEPDGFLLRDLPPDEDVGLPARRAFTFSAAQSLPQLPEGHPCRELHGHTYQVELACRDAGPLEDVAARIYDRLHDIYLNEVPGLERATAECIARWVWERVEEAGMEPSLVGVQETPHNRCYYRGQ